MSTLAITRRILKDLREKHVYYTLNYGDFAIRGVQCAVRDGYVFCYFCTPKGFYFTYQIRYVNTDDFLLKFRKMFASIILEQRGKLLLDAQNNIVKKE